MIQIRIITNILPVLTLLLLTAAIEYPFKDKNLYCLALFKYLTKILVIAIMIMRTIYPKAEPMPVFQVTKALSNKSKDNNAGAKAHLPEIPMAISKTLNASIVLNIKATKSK